MAAVVERATWEEYSNLHAVLGVVAVPVCYGLAIFLHSSRFQGAHVPLGYRLTLQVMMLFTLIFLGAALGIAIVNNNNHLMPHFKSVHSILGIVDVVLIVVRVVVQIVLNFMVRRGRAISQTLYDAMHSFLRYAIISVTLATFLTGILDPYVVRNDASTATMVLIAMWVGSLAIFLVSELAFFYSRRRLAREDSSASVSKEPSSMEMSTVDAKAAGSGELLINGKPRAPIAGQPHLVTLPPTTRTQSAILNYSFAVSLLCAIGLAIAVSQTSYTAIPEVTSKFSVKLAAFNATATPNSLPGSIHSFCQTFRLPDDDTYHIIAVDNVLDTSSTFVSMTLFASTAGVPQDSVGRCTRVQMPQAMQMVQTCMRGQSAAECAIAFAPEAGVLISSGREVNTPLKFLTIQLSYIYMGAPDLSIPTHSDRPSYELTLTKALRPFDIGILTMGGFPYEFSIPGGESFTEFSSVCAPRFTDAFITRPMSVVSYAYTAYQYAQSISLSTEHKDGSAGPSFANNNFSSTNPLSYIMHQPLPGEEIQFFQHDTIRISCTYDTSSVPSDMLIYGGPDASINEACSVRVMYWPTSDLTPLVCANISSFNIENTFKFEDIFAYDILYEPAFVIASFLAWYAAFWIINAVLVRVSVHYIDLSMEKKRLVLGYFIEIIVQCIFLVMYLRVIWLTWVNGEFIGAHLIYLFALSYYTIIMYICELIVRCDVSVSTLAHHLATTCLFLIAIYPADITTTAVWEYCVLMIVFVYVEMPTFVALAAYRLCGNPVIVRRIMMVSIVTYVISRLVNDVWAIYILAARGGEMGLVVIALVIFTALIIYAQWYSFMAQYGIYKRVDKACKELERASKPSLGKGPPGVLSRQRSVAAAIEEVASAKHSSEPIERLRHTIEQNRAVLASLEGHQDEASVGAITNLNADIAYLEETIARLELNASAHPLPTLELNDTPMIGTLQPQSRAASPRSRGPSQPGSPTGASQPAPHISMAPARVRASSRSLDPDASLFDALEYTI